MDHEEGVVLVELRNGVTADELNERLALLDYVATKQVVDKDVSFGFVTLTLADGVSVEDAQSRIVDENSDIILAAQPNYVYQTLENESAGEFSALAGASLPSTIFPQATKVNDTRSSEQWALERVEAYEAWDIARTDGAVTVAVIDNGCLVTHEDLEDNIVATYNAVDGSTDVTPVTQDRTPGHGTHVCGIIAAEANNGKGIAGVSYNARLLPIQVFEWFYSENQGAYVVATSKENLLKAYAFVVENADAYKIKVANMSVGVACPTETPESVASGKDSEPMAIAVKRATEAGVLTVTASGNDAITYKGPYINFPGDWLDCSLNVVATTNADDNARASYSNYNMEGQTVKNISAPGEGILSAYYNPKTPSLSGNSGYDSRGGTSMAAPHVSGIAALVFSLDLSLTPENVRDVLCDTATDLNAANNVSAESTFDYETGYGLVNARKAVEAVFVERLSLEGAEVALSSCEYTYDGEEKEPGVTVTLNGLELARDTDYTVEYFDNVNAGTATALVKGKGAYDGSVTKDYIINRAPLSSAKLSEKRFVYDGQAKSPTVIVRGAKGGSSGQVLAKGVDYKQSTPSGRKAVGAYIYKVTGKGNYYGTKTLTMKVVPEGTEIVKLTPTKKGFTVQWAKQLKQTTGYRIQYSLSKDFSSGIAWAVARKNTRVAKTISNLKAKKRYYVRVRAFKAVDGVRYPSAWSAAKSVVTK